MSQLSVAASPRPEDRRVFARHEVCVPVWVRLLDERGQQAISDAAFGVVRDVSAGGLRFEVLGELAQQLSGATPGAAQVELRFIPPSLAALPAARGRVRWTRPNADGLGWSAGLQYGPTAAQTREELLAALLGSASAPARSTVGTGVRLLLGAGLLLGSFVAGMALAGRQHEGLERRERRLQRQVEGLAEDHASCLEQVSAGWRRHAGLRLELSRCQARPAPGPDPGPLRQGD